MRLRLAGAAVALAALPLAAAPPAIAAADPDYTITVEPAKAGATIDDSMYGVFFEDINFAADGGLYAELVRNRSFEFTTADNRSYDGLTAWATTSANGTAGVVDDGDRLNERNRSYLKLDLSGAPFGVTNAGYNSGVAVKQGELYDFSVWARTDAAGGTPLTISVASAAPITITVRNNVWTKYTRDVAGDRDQ